MADNNTRQAPKRRRAVTGAIVVAIGLVVLGGGWAFLDSHNRARPDRLTGYVASDDVTVSSRVGGTLTRINVSRGDRVRSGQPLFDIDATIGTAEADRASAQVSAVEAQVAQQQAMSLRAQSDLRAAQANADRASAELRRVAAAQAEKAGTVASLQVDQADAANKEALDKRDAARAAVRIADAAILAARDQVAQAQASLRSARREVADLASVAPKAGRIEDVMFKPGENVPPNAPVVTIVPDGDVKVRFYVSEGRVSEYKPGRNVAIGCDGCPAGLTAIVVFVSGRPEYTPPIIYSLDARQKLVYMVEAVPSTPDALMPGQPMDVAANASDLKPR